MHFLKHLNAKQRIRHLYQKIKPTSSQQTHISQKEQQDPRSQFATISLHKSESWLVFC